MRQTLLRFLALILLAAVGCLPALGQVTATAPLSGTIADQAGAVVVGATIKVINQQTNEEFTATTKDNGVFIVPALAAGLYTVRVTAQGFKQAVAKDVKVDVGTPTNINISLEVGGQTEEVVVEATGELLQTTSANVSTTITGRQITELPFASRDALDLVLLLPGTATPGRPRTSTVNGLPKGSLNITIDGLNVQDNLLKSSDGFFTYIRPRIDAIEEVSVSTATPGAESSGEGAVQIKFVTRGGTNEFRGSVYEYHRNPALNSNYYFNKFETFNAAGQYVPLSRARVILNQFGGKVGGPIIRDRVFFFTNYEEFRLPEQTLRTRTILNPQTQAGVFQYVVGGQVRSVNLLTLAGANNQTSTIDPTVGKLLADIRATTSQGTVQQLSDPNYQSFRFINTGSQVRRFPTVRFDINLTSKHHLENIWNYQKFQSTVDFLNGVDPAFPGFPNFASQGGDRFSNVMALRSTLTPTLVNEARFGLVGGTTRFFPEVTTAAFANQGGLNLGIGAAGISGATVATGTFPRNTPVWQFNDTVSWTRGSHNLNFGFNFTQINSWTKSQTVVPGIGFGLAAGDPATAIFDPANFPGASTAQIGQAAAIYAVLTGRITSVSGNAFLNEETNQYEFLGPFIQRSRQREIGFFGQDTWRMRPNFTLTYGLRYEVQFPFRARNSSFSQVAFEDLFGISGAGNLFKPGTTTGRAPQFTAFGPDDKAYETDKNNLAPSLGLAWVPNWKNSLLQRVFGDAGQTVIRAGYSVAYNREGLNTFLSILGSNTGGSLPANRSIALGNLTPGTLLRGGVPGPPSFPATPSFPIPASRATSINAFLPDLQTGYVQSWTFGIQRELNRDTVVEARYVGNRGVKLWQQYNLNETNVVENGFINEFKAAQANLAANVAAGRGNTFAYFGPNTGTSPLPIIVGHFNGVSAANAGNAALYTSAFFRNAAFINPLNSRLPSVIGFANTLENNPSLFAANARAAGLPRNLFLVNPDVAFAGSFLVDNSGRSYFDALVLEVRRRLAAGLLIQGSYNYSRSLTNMYASSSVVFFQPGTLRDRSLDKTTSPFDIKHALKANWIYELPFGAGRPFLDRGGFADRVVGGWEFHGTARLQSGTPFNFGNVQMIGLDKEDFQDALDIYAGPNASGQKVIFYLPQDIIQNTINAFNGITPPEGARYLAPVNLNQPVAFTGERGFRNLVFYGPDFTRFDLSVVKKTKITERVNFEFRAEFLNAFNNTNFRIGGAANDVTFAGFGQTFGQTNQAYQDLSTTNDPGGRLIQFVARVNF